MTLGWVVWLTHASSAGAQPYDPFKPAIGREREAAKPRSEHPRVMISLGLGTAVGVAHGEVEQTYRRADPTRTNGYDERDQACALARWYAAGTPLPGSTAEFTDVVEDIERAAPEALRGTVEDLAQHYDARRCQRRESVHPGLAWGGLFVRPEVLIPVSKSLYIGAFSRVQVFTGSKFATDDPHLPLAQSYAQDVTSASPRGWRQRPPTSWTVGLVAKYFFSAEGVRPFAGAFAGYGRARLRVPMSFANDRNGNGVSDDRERSRATVGDPVQGPTRCVAVWPYNGCSEPGSDAIPRQVAGNAMGDRSVDTVALGPWFVGALGGLHVQLMEHLALTTELRLGLWFPATASLLVDVSAGPAVTF